MTLDELLNAEMAKKPWKRRVFAITAAGRDGKRSKLFRCRVCARLVQEGETAIIEKFEKVTYGYHRKCLETSTMSLSAVVCRCGF